jgi:hypothetical protein
MNTYLESSSKRYPKELKQALIHPISTADGLIITELIALMDKAGLAKIKIVLEQYKYLKDSEIREALAGLNAKAVVLPEDEADIATEGIKPTNPFKTGLIFTRNWIHFKGYRMDLEHVLCYEKKDEYKVTKGVMEYLIIINPLPETTSAKNVTSNKVISYSDMDQRDADFVLLDEYMSHYSGITFINERTE